MPSEAVSPTVQVKSILNDYALTEDYQAKAFGGGHVNDTFCISIAGKALYLLQRINPDVFENSAGVMRNHIAINERLSSIAKANPELGICLPELKKSRSGDYFHIDETGAYWRMVDFIEGSTTYDDTDCPKIAFQAANAFGEFQYFLHDLALDSFEHTIPDFQNGEWRFKQFEQALTLDSQQRAELCSPSIDFALNNRELCCLFEEMKNAGKIHERVTHGDCKINNVLLSKQTSKALCVIDLDTVMPGYSLYDFGDIVRTSTCTSPEDEADLSKVMINLDLFEAVSRGYLEYAHKFLNDEELEALALSGACVSFMIGLRFLTDYLSGDKYFKTKHPNHNLERAQAQFQLAKSILENQQPMQEICSRLVNDYKQA